MCERKSKQKNTCRVFLERKASGKTQNRSWLVCAGEKSVCMRGKISKKHMSCVFKKKSKRKNTNRKLVGVCRGENWARREIGERKNPRRGRRKRKAS